VTEAARVVVKTVADFLKKQTTSVKGVVFVLFDANTFPQYLWALKVTGRE